MTRFDAARRWLSILVLILSMSAAGAAQAKTLLDDEPGKADSPSKRLKGGIVEPDGGTPGWRSRTPGRVDPRDARYPGGDFVEYALDNAAPGFSPDRGSIRIELKRTEPSASQNDTETLFEFLGPDNRSRLTVYIRWSHPDGPPHLATGSYLTIGDSSGTHAIWGHRIPLGRPVLPGETVRLTFNWGGGRNAILVDGNEVGGYYLADGEKKSSMTGAAGAILAGADRLRLGIAAGPFYPHGRNPLNSASILRIALSDLPSGTAPVISSVSDDSFRLPGISGKLVAGDTVTATLVAQPGGRASFDMGRVKGIAMAELPADPGGPGKAPVSEGTYRGSYTIRPGDDFEDGQIAGKFVSSDNVAAEPVLSSSRWTIVTKPSVTFSIASKDLPADEGTKSRIKLTAKDANGNPLKGRNLKLTLSTTDEYTGTVGAGDFGKQVGASVETRWKGATDAWGEVEFDYVAGFAAKTVILQAKDLDSGGVSVDYITAYKEASIDIALTAPRSLAAARRGLQYSIRVEASRTQLTADGRSRSVIRATVSDPNGAPVAGDPVSFSLSSENGTLRTIQGTTDSSGVATAEYIAGKKIGIVVISATDTVRNVSGNVSILLLADAPAKIHLKARPETLPADGNSKADIQVKVTDINDNPNQDTRVEFRITRGAGKLDHPDRITDRYGDALNRFTAGTTPGIATVLAVVRSKVPTPEELLKAKNVLFVPFNEAGDEIRIENWLKKKGDTVLRGEPIVSYTVGRSRDLLTIDAPYDLTMGETFVEYWDNAEVGQTLATVVPTTK